MEFLKNYNEDLKGVSSSVAHTGEGEWTVKTGKKLNEGYYYSSDNNDAWLNIAQIKKMLHDLDLNG